MTDALDEHHPEGQTAYRRGHYREAAVRFELAREQAQRNHQEVEAFQLAVDAANSWHLAGNPVRGLSLLTEILADVPAGIELLDLMAARRVAFELCRCFQPNVSDLERRLAEFRETVGGHHGHSQAFIFRLESVVRRAEGRHQEAVQALERAWSHQGDTNGFAPYLTTYGAVFSHLALGNMGEAERWCGLLEEADAGLVDDRAAWCEARARIALYRRDVAACEQAVQQLRALVAHTHQPIWQRRLVMVGVRASLLHYEFGDPLAPRHPAWSYLRMRVRGMPEVYDRYDRALLIVDYRLAAVRFSMGVSPVEDLYYGDPQQHSAPAQLPGLLHDEIARRVATCHKAIRRARARAEALDSAFYCDWRQREVASRGKRLESLLQVDDPSQTTGR